MGADKIAVVAGNGKSLATVPDEFLKRYKTFGTNRCYLRFVPDYYVCVNRLVLSQFRDEIDALKSKKYLMGTNLIKTLTPFSKRLPEINEGYTVTYACLQIAYILGFETVLLVGVDHDYQFTGTPNQTLNMNGDDPNHFDPSYFRGAKWQAPDLKQSEKYYNIARAVYEQAGRKIINLTEGTKLNIFERGNLAEWI